MVSFQELFSFNRLPSIQSIAIEETDANSNEDRPLSPLSVNSEEERQLLQQVKRHFSTISFQFFPSIFNLDQCGFFMF